MSTTTKAAWITGSCVVLAAIIGVYKYSPKPQPEGHLVTGIVVEEGTDRAVPQALVSIIGRTEQSASRDNGNFRLVLPPDSPVVVTLRVTKSGYQPHNQDVQVPVEGLTIQIQKQ
jgi:Carboxypeptidase regulatory-like domain